MSRISMTSHTNVKRPPEARTAKYMSQVRRGLMLVSSFFDLLVYLDAGASADTQASHRSLPPTLCPGRAIRRSRRHQSYGLLLLRRLAQIVSTFSARESADSGRSHLMAVSAIEKSYW